MRIQVSKHFADAAIAFVNTKFAEKTTIHHNDDGSIFIFLKSNTSTHVRGTFFGKLYEHLYEIESAYCVELIVT